MLRPEFQPPASSDDAVPAVVKCEAEDDAPPAQKKRLMDWLQGDVIDLTSSQSSSGSSPSEYSYFQKKVVHQRDPLLWWKANESRFVTLRFIATIPPPPVQFLYILQDHIVYVLVCSHVLFSSVSIF